MATDLSIGEKPFKSNRAFSCNYAPQCLWYETKAATSSICINRDTLACQKRCEEVFGQNDIVNLKITTN
jgi:hypothetical protein